MFDVESYARYMDELFVKMGQIMNLKHPDNRNALENICRLLRIGRVEVFFYETIKQEKEGDGGSIIIFQDGEVDETRYYSQREMTGGASVAIYHIHQREQEDDWNEIEQEKISILQKILFVFQGRMRLAELMDKLTFIDKDLDIFNLTYFLKQTEIKIESGDIGKYAVAYFNLKRFALVNQCMGRENGTKVMRSFVKQLQEQLWEDGYVCRIGGDNFVMLFRREQINTVINYLNGTPIVCPGTEERTFVEAHAGYYLIAEDSKSATDIMDRVSAAFHLAKNVLHVPYMFYDENFAERKNKEKMLENIFRSGVEQEEFKVYYQPKVLLKDGTMVGAEALCRWFHDGELIAPEECIPILEKSNAVCTLDFYMLEHVCRTIRKWLDQGLPVVRISVNFSRKHLGEMDLVEKILGIVDKYQVPHEYIEIELTETTSTDGFKDLKELVWKLKEAGISTSMDDFGVGYSSLNLIREVPWTVLKIDKSLLPAGEEPDEQKGIMLKYLVSMIQDMGLECIVEGVETLEQVNLLKENNCHLVQGFYFGRPLPEEVFEERMSV